MINFQVRKNQLLLALLCGVLIAACVPQSTPENQPKPVSQQITQSAQIILNFGDNQLEYPLSLETPLTALSALTQVASASGKQIVVKSYSFGSLVESIDGYANSSELAWIYFVNGQAASMAADTYTLQSGDSIEWRYTKPE